MEYDRPVLECSKPDHKKKTSPAVKKVCNKELLHKSIWKLRGAGKDEQISAAPPRYNAPILVISSMVLKKNGESVVTKGIFIVMQMHCQGGPLEAIPRTKNWEPAD